MVRVMSAADVGAISKELNSIRTDNRQLIKVHPGANGAKCVFWRKSCSVLLIHTHNKQVDLSCLIKL